MNKKKIMSAIKALAAGVKGNAKLIKENQQAISKLTQRFEALSEHSDYLDRLTTELSHALPDPEYDARCKAAAADASESLVKHGARLGLTEPEVKTLDQSGDCPEGLVHKNQFVCIESTYENMPVGTLGRVTGFDERFHTNFVVDGRAYEYAALVDGDHLTIDAGNAWKAVFKRIYSPTSDSTAKELADVDLSSKPTASDISLAWLKNQKMIFGKVSDASEDTARARGFKVISMSTYKTALRFNDSNCNWRYCVAYDANGNEITELPDADLKPGDVLLREDWHDYFEEGARYIVTDDLRVKDLQGDEWPFLRKTKDLYVFGLNDAATACFVKAEEEVHG